ncbi:unnamed protein product [Mortierella alpina]
MEVLWCDRDQDILDLTAVIKWATRARFHRHPKATKIQRLQLPSKRNREHSNPLPLLLLRSSLLDLESCEIPWFEVDTNPKKIEWVVRKNCPKLKHVICPSFKDQELDGQGVDSFIYGCTGIQSFTSNRFVDQESEPEPRCILSTLVGRHSYTLEVLELTQCYQANSCELQDILSQCRRLKKFWVMNSSPGDYNIGIESTHILKEKWVCIDLRKLGLTLNRFPEVDDVFADLEAAEKGAGDLDDWDEAKSRLLAMAAKNVYTQIGRLAKLEILVLSIDRGTYSEANQGDYAWDLTLSKGWLGEMVGLKSLKTLILQGDFWSMMGQAEVEFIHEHWPALKEISLSVLTNGSSTDSSQPCTQLKRLEIKEFNYVLADLTSRYLATLFDLNHCLTELEFPIEFLNTEAVSASLSKLENLQRLTVSSTCRCEGKQPIVLLRSCLRLPNLPQLFIKLDMWWPGNDQGILLKAVIEEASVARFSRDRNATRIKSPQLPSNRNGGNNPLPLLLLKCKLLDLESCEIPWFDPRTDPDGLTQVAREHCSNLKHLTCLSFKDNETDGHDACAFIKGCAGLRSFNSDRFSDQEYEVEARCIISTLAAHHSDTLEVFELTECHQASSREQQEILSRCKQLKLFWVMNSSPYDNYFAMKSTDILREKWVCMDLTKLGLTLNRFPDVDDVFEELEAAGEEVVDLKDWARAERRMWAVAGKNVYTQIGRLAKLEVLMLSIDRGAYRQANEGDYAWDLKLLEGWLRELKGLKSLKTLILWGDLWSQMGLAEVEFIHEHWPLLSEIRLCGNSLPPNLQLHLRWLLDKRPQLHLYHEP